MATELSPFSANGGEAVLSRVEFPMDEGSPDSVLSGTGAFSGVTSIYFSIGSGETDVVEIS